MLIMLRIMRVIVAVFGIWQVIGLLPVVTWLGEPQAITLGMAVIAAAKVFTAAACAGLFYWLGNIKRKRSTEPERFGDLAIAGICLVVVVVAGIALALVFPISENVKNIDLSISNGVEDGWWYSDAPLAEPAPGSSAQRLAGEWRCTRDHSTQATQLILHPNGSVSSTVEGSSALIADPWLHWYVPSQISKDQMYFLHIKIDSENSIAVKYPNGKIDKCAR